MEIKNAHNISIFGLKSEGNHTILRVSDSKDIRLFGYGGNAAALPGKSLFKISNSTDFTFVNLVDAPRLASKKGKWIGFGHGVDPKVWHILEESFDGGPAIRTRPLERPVIYKRIGEPSQ